jgi:hypothetical protein
VPTPPRESARRQCHVEVTTIAQIDAIDPDAASRMTNMLMAAVAGRREGDEPLRVETVYDEERVRMKVVTLGNVAACAELLRLIGVLAEADA